MDLPVVNRSAVILIANQSFLDWINHHPILNLTLTLEDLNDEPIVFLIQTQTGEPDEWLERNYLRLFEEELEGWHTDESLWPEDLSYAAFRQFFEVRFSSLVVDTISAQLKWTRMRLDVPKGRIVPIRLVTVPKLSPEG